ncbi:BspA family leucine-rich repeat surface protein [Elizabethkingia anophelis]|nr:BspA family leucine-rich repeat surface protein [Elizabethkingia anophelis]
MDTLVLKTYSNASGLLPRVGNMSIKFLGQGNRSNYLAMICRGDGTAKIEGGFIVLDDGTEVTEKLMNGGEIRSLNVKVTGDYAYVHLPSNGNLWVIKEYITAEHPKDKNTPIMDLTSRMNALSGFNTAMFTGVNLPNRPLSGLDLSNIGDFQNFFAYNPLLNQNVHNIGIKGLYYGHFMFAECYAFNGRIDGLVTPTTTATPAMFENCYSLNQPWTLWDMRNNPRTERMLRNTISFDQDISGANFNIESDFTGFMDGCGMSPENYGKFLVMLDTKFDARTSVKKLDAWGVKYTSGAGKTARASLINKGWTIIDGGEI